MVYFFSQGQLQSNKAPLKRSQHFTELRSTFVEQCIVMLSGVQWGGVKTLSTFALYKCRAMFSEMLSVLTGLKSTQSK